MQMPSFFLQTVADARRNSVWAFAFLAALLLPIMLVVARAGIEICCAIIGLTFLWHAYRTRQWQWLRTPFARVCVAAWAWLALVVTPLAAHPEAGMMDALMWFRLPLMLVACREWVLASPQSRTTLAVFVALVLVLVVIDTVWQSVAGISLTGHLRLYTGRLTGPFSNPKVGLYLGQLVVPVAALCFAGARKAGHRGGMVASAVLLVVVVATIMLTGERSAFVGTMLACAVAMGLLMLRDARLRIPGLAVAGLVVVAIVGLYSANDWVHVRGQQMVDVMTHYPDSDYGLLVRAAITVGGDHLAHGVGLRGFRDFCPDLDYRGLLFRGIHPHNAFGEWFAEAGLPGLLLFVAMIGALLHSAWVALRGAPRQEGFIPAVALGVMAQHFFPVMGMQSFFSNWPALLLWYTLALIFAAVPMEQGR